METNDCTQSITSNRIDWLDIAKCIGMFLVIHNHFNLNYGNDIIKIIIASFHMPLFFVASGYTVKQISGISGLLRYIIKRMIGILFPYYLLAMLFSDFSIKNILCIVYGSHQTLSATGGYIAVGWFLPCLFMTNVIVGAIIYVLHDKNNILIDVFIVFALFTMSYILLKIKPSVGYPMNLDISFMGAGFAYSGHMIKKYAVLEKIKKSTGGGKTIILLFVAVIVTVVASLFNIPSQNNDYHRSVMALGYVGILPLFVISGLAGSMVVFIISGALEKTFLRKSFSLIGRKTLVILMIHQFFIRILEKLIGLLAIKPLIIYPPLLGAFVLTISFVIAEVMTNIYPNLEGKFIFPNLTEKMKNKKGEKVLK